MHIWGETVVNLIVEQVAALLTDQDELLSVAKLVFNLSRQGFSETCWIEMNLVPSKLLVFPVGRDAGLGFRGMGFLVFGQFCICHREASGGKMVGSGGEFPVKPAGTDLRRILIAHAMRYKSGVRNGHEILRGFAARRAEGEGVLADRALGFKSNVL